MPYQLRIRRFLQILQQLTKRKRFLMYWQTIIIVKKRNLQKLMKICNMRKTDPTLHARAQEGRI